MHPLNKLINQRSKTPCVFVPRTPCGMCFQESIRVDFLQDYPQLSYKEYFAILSYRDENDRTGINELAQSTAKKTPSFGLFLERFIDGKEKRPPRQKALAKRKHWDIAREVRNLMKEGHRLKCSQHKKGAAAIVADKYHKSPETVETIYKYFVKRFGRAFKESI